jgi:hypothetical protein
LATIYCLSLILIDNNFLPYEFGSFLGIILHFFTYKTPELPYSSDPRRFSSAGWEEPLSGGND